MPGYFDPNSNIDINDINLIDDLPSYLEKKKKFPNYRKIPSII